MKIHNVDINGRIIKSLKDWKKANPTELYFDSEFERKCYLILEEAGFDFTFHPETRELAPSFQTLAYSNTGKKLFKSTVRNISYTSDFAIFCNNGMTIFIETKGFFHADARIRYKLFQRTLSKDEISLLIYDTKTGLDNMKNVVKIINKDFGGSTKKVAKAPIKITSI